MGSENGYKRVILVVVSTLKDAFLKKGGMTSEKAWLILLIFEGSPGFHRVLIVLQSLFL